MKKFLAFYLVISFIFCLSGCKGIENEAANSTYDGVYLTYTRSEGSNGEMIFDVTWHNETAYEITYDNWFTIEYWEDNEWVTTKIIDADLRNGAYVIAPKSVSEKEYSTQYFDLYREGKYRLRTSCKINDGKDTICSTWVEFDIADIEELDLHKVTMTSPSWLYERLKSHYRTGYDVVVRISSATDLGTMLFANGKLIEMESYGDDYWQYRFTMPDEDVVLEFRTYDGFLRYPNESLLIETYWIQNPDADYVSVRKYYGEYDSGAIVAMIASGDYTDALWSETVGESVFNYSNGNRITVLKDGAFCDLPTAFAKGYLTERDIADICDIHNGGNGIRRKIEGYGTSMIVNNELKEKYYPGDEVVFKIETTEAFMPHLFINEAEIGPELVNLSEGYVQFRFIMPNEDVDCNVEYVIMEGWQ